MPASVIVDLGNIAQHQNTISPVNGVDSTPASGQIVGQVVDLVNAHMLTNLVVAGGPSSGIFRIVVQTSDAVTSGSFTDPTSGLAQMPTAFLSGGVLVVNSGLWASGTQGLPTGGVIDSAPLFCSGATQIAGFQRPQRYARAMVLSGGAFNQPITAAFVAQLHSPGSGFGFTYSPTSGTINV